MTAKAFSLNKQFKELLQHLEGTSITRKKLIQLAATTTELDTIQSTRFVARNIGRLTINNLVTASGTRNHRIYHFTDAVLNSLKQEGSMLKLNNSNTDTKDNNQEGQLKIEEIKTGAELKMILGEIDAYRDFLTKYPANRQIIQTLLHQAKEHSTQLYGRLNALKKVMLAANIESATTC